MNRDDIEPKQVVDSHLMDDDDTPSVCQVCRRVIGDSEFVYDYQGLYVQCHRCAANSPPDDEVEGTYCGACGQLIPDDEGHYLFAHTFIRCESCYDPYEGNHEHGD